jgi:high-affinity Fe2+/Pb2+ permease
MKIITIIPNRIDFKLLAYQAVTVIIGLGVFFAFLLGATVAQGGAMTLEMTVFNEMWPEYWLMFISVGVIPWALYYLDDAK